MSKKKINFKEMKQINQTNYYVPPNRPDIPKFPIPKDLTAIVMTNLRPFPGMTEKSVQFMQILEQIKSDQGLELKASNYLHILKIMLYVEEIQNNLDMRRYDQEKKRIMRIMHCAEYFKVYVDGLMEDRPSVRPGDIVEIRDAETKKCYLLNVTNVMDDHIIATGSKRFCDMYSAEKLYNVRFRFQNYPVRCCHYALGLINRYQLTPNFFPIKRPTCINPSSNLHWYNKSIESNPEQKQAVLNIACKSSSPYPYILYGPPGTGKTATLVEAICQVWQANPADNILVCTPSNAAADVITKRLLAYVPENNIYRMYSPSKEGSQIDEEIIGCSNFVDGQVMMLPKELVKIKKIVISTLCASIRLLFFDFKVKHFSYVFIDEAGQAIEPDALIPFNLLSSVREEHIGKLHGQVVIAGDPQQLGPGIRSKYAEPILGRSMLERLMDCEPYKKNEHGQYHPGYITKLLQNYRSHPQIIQVSNEIFYDSELKACGDGNIYKAIDWLHLPHKKFPIIFHGVEGTEVKDDRSPSSYNIEELKIVRHYVRLLMAQTMTTPLTESEIGIVTPFTAQRVKLHRALNEDNFSKIDVGTVELFQGQEKDVIILSTVRSKTFHHDGRKHIGFLSNPKRFNVALTRAKALLIVVGNPKILQTDAHWKYFLKFCKDNNACRGVEFEIENDDLEIQFPRVRRLPHIPRPPVADNFDTIDVVNLDDGVAASPTGSVVDENEYPKPAVSKSVVKSFNGRPQFTAPRTETVLCDVPIRSMAELKLEKQTAKKEKKKKKKQYADEELPN